MSPLNRLLIHEVRRMWRQGLAISILLACGIATFVMSRNAMHSLEWGMASYYAEFSFAHVFVDITRAPESLAERLKQVPGTVRVETRIVREVIADIPGMIEPATCRLISTQGDPTKRLNGLVLRQGRFPVKGDQTEVVASELFAEAHGFRPGDTIDVIMGERKDRLRIVGLAMSPEFIYTSQPGMLLTDNRRFGVLWMSRRQMESAFNMEGAFNNAVITVNTSASRRDVMFHVDRLTEKYGGIGSYDRSDQESHQRVADELHQMNNMAFVMPLTFLAVSTFLINIVLSRMIRQQSEQIATLRAFGMTSWEIGSHYAKLLVLLVSLGAIVGCLVGVLMGRWMTEMYEAFFRFPKTYLLFAWPEAVFAVLAGYGAAFAGGFFAIRRAARLPPAVAMRPEVPKLAGKSITHTMLSPLFSPITRMIVRRLEGNLWTTMILILGMSLALAVLVLGSFMEGTIAYVVDVQFNRSNRQDVMLTFGEKVSPSAVHDVAHLPGVRRVEPFRAVPVRMCNGARTHRLSLMGLEADPTLYRVLDAEERPVSFPRIHGLTVSKKLAEILDVRVGDPLHVEILEGEKRHSVVPVARIFPDFASPGAYMNRYELHQLLQESEQVSGAFLSVAPDSFAAFYGKVKETPAVAGVLDKRSAELNFRKAISENTSIMRIVNAGFASAIAFGVIYNCALITLAERNRDLATLRVMGFTRAEVSLLLFGELAIITLFAIPIGLPIGYGFAFLTTLAIDTETNRFPLVVQRATFADATTVMLIAATASAFYVGRALNRVDLISALKVKE